MEAGLWAELTYHMSTPETKHIHTPGPWVIINGHVYHADNEVSPFTNSEGVEHLDYRTGLLALVYGTGNDGKIPSGDQLANARLIAAAPDMLDAIRIIYANAAESPEWIRSRLAPVLAKAEGRS